VPVAHPQYPSAKHPSPRGAYETKNAVFCPLFGKQKKTLDTWLFIPQTNLVVNNSTLYILWKYCDTIVIRKSRFAVISLTQRIKLMKPDRYLTSAVLLVSTSIVFAQAPATPSTSPGTITASKLTFANANAKYATPASIENTNATKPAAMRAYVDRETGELTKPTQLQQLEDAERAKSDRAKSVGRTAIVHSMEAMAGGGMRGKVSDAAHSFMSASLNPKGELIVQCEENHAASASIKGRGSRATPHTHILSNVTPALTDKAIKESSHVK
jgi:hypothetical protein